MSDAPALIADHVSKQFPGGQRPAVDDCSFTVNAGELIILLGTSGCGKTTLLKMVNRLYEPTGGRILFHGTDITQLPATALRRQIGYVIQQTGLFPHMRIADNIAVVPRLLGWQPSRTDARIDELLTLVGLPIDYRQRYPRQLSGGEQQRVGIARALAADPAVMLMDEPFGAIDAITRTRLQGELLQLQEKLHKTILFVTHDVEEALRLADRIIVMRDGKILQFDTPLRVLTEPVDDFVAQLIGADDLLRQLSLLKVGTLTTAPVSPTDVGDGSPQVRANDDVRHALALLLGTGAQRVLVIDDAGHVTGQLGFGDVQRALHHDLAVGS
ncbi:MAG: ABC transporter ATP-binding protein [Herpetosiphonaceae bacterium]|nr:ABC transporter ATP-binding protein [Herpetosiphonaceae bacterium]